MDKEQHIEADEQHVPDVPSPGQVLREAREEQGLTQQAIADKLYLKVGIIDDLEQNRIDDSTSVTFFKGYVRLYAKNLGLNPEEVLTLFNQYHTTPKPPAKLQSFSRRVAKQAHDDRWMMVTYGIAIVLIAGVVVWWYQQPANDSNELPAATKSAQKQSAATPVKSVPQPQPAVTQPDESPASTVITGEADTEVPVEPSQQNVAEDKSSPVDTVVDESVEMASPANDEASPQVMPEAGEPVALVFNFTADCWVNITDASGEAIAYGIKAAGYEMQITGLPPFEVTLGAPDVVQISYDGEAVDMSGFDPTRTAKFSLPMQEQ